MFRSPLLTWSLAPDSVANSPRTLAHDSIFDQCTRLLTKRESDLFTATHYKKIQAKPSVNSIWICMLLKNIYANRLNNGLLATLLELFGEEQNRTKLSLKVIDDTNRWQSVYDLIIIKLNRNWLLSITMCLTLLAFFSLRMSVCPNDVSLIDTDLDIINYDVSPIRVTGLNQRFRWAKAQMKPWIHLLFILLLQYWRSDN